MNRSICNHLAYAVAVTALGLLAVASLGWPESARAAEKTAEMPRPATTMPRVDQNFGKLPLHFEPNLGQAHPQAKFLTRGRGFTLLLEPTQAVLALRAPVPKGSNAQGAVASGGASDKQALIRLRFLGANSAPELTGGDALPGRSNYFLGNDKSTWRRNVPHYAHVRYRDVYPGIDLVYYGLQQKLEYDLIIAPGADPNVIRMRFEGIEELSLDAQGNLVLHTASGNVVQQVPVIFQELAGERRAVAGGYVLRGKNEVGFSLTEYDRSQTLVIDPTVVYSTFLGGSQPENAYAIAADAAGNAYITGQTGSVDFPTTAGALRPACSPIGVSCDDAFVTKLNASGALVYSTYFGGSEFERGIDIAVDAAGGAYVTGVTYSSDFPNTVNPFQSSCSPSAFTVTCTFISKLDATGSNLEYSTLLAEGVSEIEADAAGHVYVTGATSSTGFPVINGLPGPSSLPSAFISKLNPSGTALVYSTLFGGSAQVRFSGSAIDADGNAVVAGTGDASAADFPLVNAFQTDCHPSPLGICSDGFVSKISPAGSSLVFSTYLGGSGGDSLSDVAVDASGNVYVGGRANSNDFPTTQAGTCTIGPGGCGIVAKFDPVGSLVFSTFMPFGNHLGVDGSGNIYGANGQPSGTPVNSLQDCGSDGRPWQVFKLDPMATQVIFSTCWGSIPASFFPLFLRGFDVDASGNVYLAGTSYYPEFPTHNAMQPNFAGPGCEDRIDCFGGDAVVAKISPADNTPADTGLPVTVVPVEGVSVTFPEVNTSGTTSFTPTTIGPAPPSGFSLGDPPNQYEISTTATYTGLITICINYSNVLFSVESELQLLHYENNAWVDVTLPGYPDTTNNVICGQVSSLSPFVIAAPPTPPLTISGLQPPLASLVPEGSEVPFPDKAFKLGRTLPLRFQMLAGSTPLTDSDAVPPQIVGLVRVGAPPLDLQTLDLDAGQTNDSGLLFRFEDGSWAYNLSTHGLSAGTYVITIRMPDSLRYTAGFVLR